MVAGKGLAGLYDASHAGCGGRMGVGVGGGGAAAVVDRLRGAAREALGGVRSREELYRIVAECLSLCETVEEAELRELLLERRGARAEKDSDRYLVVARLVFEGRRDVVWRYAVAMRVAAQHQVRSVEFPDWVGPRGGLNALWAEWRAGRAELGGGGWTVVGKAVLGPPLRIRIGEEWTTVQVRVRSRGGVLEWRVEGD